MCERDKFHKVESCSSEENSEEFTYRDGAHTKRRTVGVGIWDSSECGSDIILSARMMEQLWGNSSFFIPLCFQPLVPLVAVSDDSNAKSGYENVKSQQAKPRKWMNEGMKSIINAEQALKWWFSIQKLALLRIDIQRQRKAQCEFCWYPRFNNQVDEFSSPQPSQLNSLILFQPQRSTKFIAHLRSSFSFHSPPLALLGCSLSHSANLFSPLLNAKSFYLALSPLTSASRTYMKDRSSLFSGHQIDQSLLFIFHRTYTHTHDLYVSTLLSRQRSSLDGWGGNY